jgi:Zn-dependent peptidase ImmA (M78 family)
MTAKIVSLSERRTARAVAGINPARERFIRTEARRLLVQAWKAEKKLRNVQVVDVLPVDPEWIARLFPDWRFLLIEHAEIEPCGTSTRQTAGVLDRVKRTIEINSNLRLTVRRFTGAHELGHLVLHPGIQSFRESPIGDSTIVWHRLPPKEQEANLFAAALLMPERLLRESFARRFQPVLYKDSIDDNTAYYCSNGELSSSDFRKMNLLEAARVLAAADSFTTADSRPLTEVFGVSATAMAIQFIDLGLVRVTQSASIRR